MLSSKCAVCESKKSRFIKEQKASSFSSKLGTAFGTSGKGFGKILAGKALNSQIK